MRPSLLSPIPSLLAGLLLTTGSAVSMAQEGTIEPAIPERDKPVSYVLEILDILDEKCLGCHNTALAENGLNMEEIAGLLEGGDSGPAIVPGNAEGSLLFRLAAHRAEPFMPPVEEEQLKPLTPEELGLLKLWIDQGAKDDTEAVLAAMEANEPIELGELPEGVHPIAGVSLGAEGRTVAFGRGNVVEVYEPVSGLPIVRLGGHQDVIQAVRYSRDGRMLGAGSYRIATIWNAPTGGPIATLSGHGQPVRAVAALPDGETIVSASSDGTLRLWKTEDGSEIRSIKLPNNEAAQALAILDGGQAIATGGADGVLRIWNVDDGALLNERSGHEGPIRAIAWVPSDRPRLATASEDGTIRLWPWGDEQPAEKGDDGEEQTGKPNAGQVAEPNAGPIVWQTENAVTALAVAPDGGALAIGGEDGRLRIRALPSGDNVRVIEAHSGPIRSLSVAPDSAWLLSASADGTAKTWSWSDGAPGVTLAHEGGVSTATFNTSGNRIATSGETGLKIWEADTGVGVIAFGHGDASKGQTGAPIHDLAFLDDSRIVSASEDKTLVVWTFEGRWSLKRTLEPHVFRVLAIDFHPEGRLVATGGGEPTRSGEVKVWDLETGDLKFEHPELHSDTVFDLRFSPDGSKLATVGADKFLRILDTKKGEPLQDFEGHTHHVLGVDWNADGTRLVTSGADHVLKFWDLEQGEQIRTSQDANDFVTAVRWAAENMVVGASGDQRVLNWNPANGRIQRTYGGAQEYLHAIDTTPEGGLVAAGGEDGVLLLWRGNNGQLVRKIEPKAASSPVPAGEE